METAIAIAAAVGLVLGTCAAVVVAVRMRRATGLARARLLWLAWGALVTITTALIGMALNLLVDWPSFV
jgi:hypothetical protein